MTQKYCTYYKSKLQYNQRKPPRRNTKTALIKSKNSVFCVLIVEHHISDSIFPRFLPHSERQNEKMNNFTSDIKTRSKNGVFCVLHFLSFENVFEVRSRNPATKKTMTKSKSAYHFWKRELLGVIYLVFDTQPPKIQNSRMNLWLCHTRHKKRQKHTEQKYFFLIF